jgi:serine protease Do
MIFCRSPLRDRFVDRIASPALWLVAMLTGFANTVDAQPAESQRPGATLQTLNRGFESLARSVNPAVVQLHVASYSRLRRGAGGATVSEERGSGSGVFVDSTGYIVTNAHVVEGAHSVQVELSGPQRGAPGEQSILRPRGDLLEATVLGIDRETDVAVLKADLPKDQGRVPALPFGNSDALRPGHLVFAIGSPRGFENSVSMGVVSATARQLKPESPMIYLQTDAPINPGSSGGPLVNTEGEIVGLNTLIYSSDGGNDGLGFAAPSNIVKAVYEQIRTHGRVRRGVIGVHAQTITPELRQELGIDRRHRVILGDVRADSPADRAGLRPGDVIAALNGKPMENGRQFDVNVYGALGSTARITVVRGDSTFSRRVRVVERPGQRSRFADLADPAEHLVERLDALLLALDDDLAALLPTSRSVNGVLVADSNRPPPPWGDQLRPGDVVSIIAGEPVTTPDAVRDVLSDHPSDDRVVAHVFRDGHFRLLVLRLQ